ncbi:pentatricopeptide repeat-containing protein At5g06540 [Beta vulgaris subsp. vulgaris]|uniref:pentatricopeptide repeat-containing protein At5g06540 n=1 Tax=Beta vulgaris subsp. vulgaris TaxID=3555 RepID=UPI0020374AEE|nr:pentatricopeptide repeat-containing protein At5g06540 [Beta vulgaris subsp. vulgaris]
MPRPQFIFLPKQSIIKHLTHPSSSSSSSSSFSINSPPSLSHIADKCTSMHQLKQLHAHMIISARIHDNYAASRLLSFCALSDSGDINYAVKLFNYTQQPNNFMYNTMIRAQASAQNPLNAVLLFVQMRRMGVLPGKHTFPFLLKACSNAKSVDGCKQVHCYVIKFGLDFELYVVNGLVRGYCVSRCLSDARQVFDEIPERNLIIWASMICGYAQNNSSDEALLLFNRMLDHGIEPNGVILASVLSACAQDGCLMIGERIEKFMREKGTDWGVILGTALVHMYAKNGALGKAREVFDSMQQKNVVTWNAMIHGLAVHGHAESALTLFTKLEMEDIVPNGITFVAVLSACCHGGFLAEGRKFFSSMKQDYNIEPKLEHYGCMVDLLGRGGELIEAEQLIRDMEWKADVMIWGTLLSACRKCGNIEVAERVVEEILALDPQNHGVHVVLSNMYAETGRWDDVLNLRKVMKKGHLKKVPGWSSVNDGG